MDAEKIDPAELQTKKAELEAYINRNPYSSTLEREQLQETEQEIENRKKDQKPEEILF